jgi:CRP/FNR family transcriptional regulator
VSVTDAPAPMNSQPVPFVSFQDDCPLFHDLGSQEQQRLSEIASIKHLQPQQVLCRQSSPSDWVYNIATGIGIIERLSTSGKRQVLSFVFPGDFAGLSHSGFFEYGIRSLTDLTAYEFPRSALYDLSEQLPQLKTNIRNISSLVQALTFDQLYLLGQKKAHERLCFFLVHMLERMPGASPTRIELPMTRQDIADFLGITVETVSRSMAKLRSEKIITTPVPQVVTVLDMAQLKKKADIM